MPGQHWQSTCCLDNKCCASAVRGPAEKPEPVVFWGGEALNFSGACMPMLSSLSPLAWKWVEGGPEGRLGWGGVRVGGRGYR